MQIAIIGAGNVGTTLGTALGAKGHDVIYGSRDPAKTRTQNTRRVSEALIGAEAVILTTPWTATEALVCEHADGLADKIVIDATNPIHPSLARLAVGSHMSGVELLQSQARRAKFFKAFNSTGVNVMAKPRFREGKAAMFVAGPECSAKETVLRIVADVGFEAVDAGELKVARLLEHLAMLWIQLALVKGHGPDFAFVMARRQHAANRKSEPRVTLAHPHPQEVE